MKKRSNLIAVVCLMAIGCGPDKPAGEDSQAEELESSCSTFCNRAVGCSEEFAERLEFETSDECLAGCLNYSNNVLEGSPDLGGPHCHPVLVDYWTCAGETPTCEIFQAVEDEAFSEFTPIEHPCGPELSSLLDGCYY